MATQFGRIAAPREAWLAKQPAEPILEPELPIIDTHHHLWDRPDHRYLLHELLADLRTGHDVGKRLQRDAGRSSDEPDVAIATALGVAMHLDGLAATAHHPILCDAGGGVEPKLGRSVVSQ